MTKPLPLSLFFLVQVLAGGTAAYGAAGFTVEEFHLHAWAGEIASAATVVGGALTLLWARWQTAKIAAAKQWQQLEASSLAAKVAALEAQCAALATRAESAEKGLRARTDEYAALQGSYGTLQASYNALQARQDAPPPAPAWPTNAPANATAPSAPPEGQVEA